MPPEVLDGLGDLALLGAWVDRADQTAFSTLVRRYHGLVLAACRRRLGAADAEDAAQAVFLVLARRSPELLGDPRPLAGWLYAVASQVARNAERARARRHHHEREAAMAAGQTTSDTGQVWNDASVHLDACLDRLPAQERDVLVLHYLAGKDRLACANELEISVEALKKRLSRGLDRLRGLLRQRGVAISNTAVLMLVLEQHASAVESTAAQIAAASTPTPAATALSDGIGAPAAGFGFAAPVCALAFIGSALALVLWNTSGRQQPVVQQPPLATTAELRWDDAARPSFWFVTMTDWTFDPDPGVDPGLVPRRAVELALIKAESRPDDSLAMQALAVWNADAIPPLELGGSATRTTRIDMGDGRPGLELTQTLQTGASALSLARSTERVVASRSDPNLRQQEHASATWAMNLERCAIPSLAWPLPKGHLPAGAREALAGGYLMSWSSPPDGDVARGLAEEGSPVLAYACTTWERRGDNLLTLDGDVFAVPIQASVSGSAGGTVDVRLRWDGRGGSRSGIGLPSWASVRADLAVTVILNLVKPATGVTHRITGRAKLLRHSWRLPGQPDGSADWPEAAPRLWPAVMQSGAWIDGTFRPWQSLADGTDPALAQLARGVLLSAEHTPQITQTTRGIDRF